ncbi:hypothetical protein ACFQ0M_04905 [Kitasatospora aburaviensis]
MSKEQRTQISAMLRQPRPDGPQSVEALRAGFKAMMAQMVVPDGLRITRTTLGDRPALYVEPGTGTRTGTILYFHGGGWVFGSPRPRCRSRGTSWPGPGSRRTRWTTGSPPSTRSRPQSRTR